VTEQASSGTIESISDVTLDPPVRGFLHLPKTPSGDGLVFTHGAGGNCRAALLMELADVFAQNGMAVLRCDLPFRQARSFGPPRPADAARDQQGLKRAVEVMRRSVKADLFLGGQSYGGRQASMLCAEEPDLVKGLLLTSYPLHPPGKPNQPRTQHLSKLNTPTLFVSGTRDPFGSIEELAAAIELIPAKTKLLAVEGAGHDLKIGKNLAPNLAQSVVRAFEELIAA
jgi:predicted alpha/beta-hydrolase family hydrolase